MASEAEDRIDQLLNETEELYSEEACRKSFNSLHGTLPERELKPKISTYMTDYIKTIGLDELSQIAVSYTHLTLPTRCLV